MKIIQALLILFSIFLISKSEAQTPLGIPYQAAARHANGKPISNSAIKVRFSILDSIATGSIIFEEHHTTTTNSFGMFNLNVGMGIAISGTLSGVNWGNNPKFLQVDLDTTATGNNYMVMGVQQFMSVPYAMFAEAVKTPNINHYIGETYAGGIIFYIDNTGQHGLVCAPQDQGQFVMTCSNLSSYYSAYTDFLGSGFMATKFLNTRCTQSNTAHKICDDLVLNGYSDWFLPSKTELMLLSRFGSLSIGSYWSSTSYTNSSGWAVNSGGEFTQQNSTPQFVRAIRAF